MRIFLDTSSLFKLYHHEADTPYVESIFTDFKITTVYLSEISKIEFCSTIWKKVRTLEITEWQALTTIQLFESDLSKYSFVPTDSLIIEQAKNLLLKYGNHGLRTLDSIQLSSCISLSNKADLFVTADKLLKKLLDAESLPTEKPAV